MIRESIRKVAAGENLDEAEMEILRLTGATRMAIINCKEDETQYLSEWKTAFRLHFKVFKIIPEIKAYLAWN